MRQANTTLFVSPWLALASLGCIIIFGLMMAASEGEREVEYALSHLDEASFFVGGR